MRCYKDAAPPELSCSAHLTRATRILALYDRDKHPHEPVFAFHVYKIFLLCSILGGRETTSAETDAVRLFGETELPPLSISRVTPAQIRRMFEHHRHPGLPTDFDHET